MLFQGPSILKFSCASGANNQSHQCRRLDTRFIIATSETILNIVKNFVRKYSKLFGNFPTAPPHSSDVRYGPAEELHDAHNDYPLAPEKVIINGVEKLAPNLGAKKEYHLTYEMLLFYLKNGLVLEAVHSAITYWTEAFLKPYIEFCAEKSRAAKKRGDKFGDDFFKLAGNSVYGKTFESTRGRRNTKFVGGGETERLTKYFSQPNFVSSTILPNSNIVMVRMGKVSVTLDKPIYLGAAILDKSKRDMFDFHYNYVMKK